MNKFILSLQQQAWVKFLSKEIICDKNEGKMMCEFQFGHISSPFSSKERLKGNSELQSVIAIAAFMGLKTTFFIFGHYLKVQP